MTFLGARRRLATLVFTCAATAAVAQTAPEPNSVPAPAEPAQRQAPVPGQTGTGTTEPAENAGIFDRDKLLGTIGGVRTGLDQYGIAFGLAEASEVLGNVSGGRQTGAVYEGLTTGTLDVDLEKLMGLSGGTFHISGLQIHGRGLSTNNVDNLAIVSSLEADRATRLFEMWYQQSFLDGKIDVKLGQQSADLEFMVSAYGGLFVNSSFGWPELSNADLPSGGPAYPLGALGARVRAKPTDALTILLGVFNGSPSGLGAGDPQGARNPSGTDFRLSDGVFVIGEAQYAINGGENATGLTGTYKLGGWYNSNAFTNQFYTSTIAAGVEGAIPPRNRRGDWAIYGVGDQLVWKPEGAKDGGVGVFARAIGGPGDRNLVNVFVDGGVTYKGVFGRDNDTVGLGLGWTHIGDIAQAEDAFAASLPGAGFTPIRSSESILELTYQAQLIPSIQVQPLFQYVFNPGGGIVNPNNPTKRLGDAAIFGVRSNITF